MSFAMKYQSYYDRELKNKAEVVEATTREIAEMICKRYEPYRFLGELIMFQSHTEDFTNDEWMKHNKNG